MKSRQLFILAPNDRFNYGDLLFPYIIKAQIGDSFDKIRYVSTSASDLSQLGGVPTEAYKVLYEVDSESCENYLIVAGGESLFSRWGIIYSFLDSRYNMLRELLFRVFFFKKGIAHLLFDFATSLLIRERTKYPFTVSKIELSGFRGVYYNSLGGCGLNTVRGVALLKKAMNQSILAGVDYIAVRDSYTSRALSSAGVDSTLVADSAILMSDVFGEEYLRSKLSIKEDMISVPYIFFQGNKSVLTKHGEVIAQQLLEIQQHSGLRVCLCPIGTALGHEDELGFQHLKPFLEQCGVDYFEICNPNIYDIMWVIKSARLYIGGSLHGIITAMSFALPYVGYGKVKLKAYIETWGEASSFSLDVEHISECSLRALSSDVDIEKLERQKHSVVESLERVALMTRDN